MDVVGTKYQTGVSRDAHKGLVQRDPPTYLRVIRADNMDRAGLDARSIVFSDCTDGLLPFGTATKGTPFYQTVWRRFCNLQARRSLRHTAPVTIRKLRPSYEDQSHHC